MLEHECEYLKILSILFHHLAFCGVDDNDNDNKGNDGDGERATINIGKYSEYSRNNTFIQAINIRICCYLDDYSDNRIYAQLHGGVWAGNTNIYTP